jgi:hypothetical protein
MAQREFFFRTECEADAFVDGVEYVNDSAVAVVNLAKDGTEEKPWRVVIEANRANGIR